MGISNAWRAAHPGETFSPFTDWRQDSVSLMQCVTWEGASMTETPQAAARRLATPALSQGFKPQALHTYTNEEGQPLFWRIRARRPNGEKWIRPMRLNGNGYELGEPKFE